MCALQRCYINYRGHATLNKIRGRPEEEVLVTCLIMNTERRKLKEFGIIPKIGRGTSS
jgi:hypothetical protein